MTSWKSDGLRQASCGCTCNCHADEGSPEWPGPCEGCCELEWGPLCECSRRLAVQLMDERAALAAAPDDALRREAEDIVSGRNASRYPARDPDCPVCAALVAAPKPAEPGLDVERQGDAEPGRLADFAESVVRQWGYVSNGSIGTGGLSTLEDAFVILGWDDPHPLAEGDPAVCDEPGCGAASSSGWPSPSGYRWTCHEHSDFHQQGRCNWPDDSPHWSARLTGGAE